VQHREPVEPVVEALAADLEQGGAVAQQHAAKPRRQASVDRKVGQAHLVAQRREAERVPSRPGRCGGQWRQSSTGREAERRSRTLTEQFAPRAGPLWHRPTIRGGAVRAPL
jgi:hypothetical protein